MQIDWWLQPRAVFGHTFSGIIRHMPRKWSQFNCMTLSWWPCHEIVSFTLHYIEWINVNVWHTYWAPFNPVTEALQAVGFTFFCGICQKVWLFRLQPSVNWIQNQLGERGGGWARVPTCHGLECRGAALVHRCYVEVCRRHVHSGLLRGKLENAVSAVPVVARVTVARRLPTLLDSFDSYRRLALTSVGTLRNCRSLKTNLNRQLSELFKICY